MKNFTAVGYGCEAVGSFACVASADDNGDPLERLLYQLIDIENALENAQRTPYPIVIISSGAAGLQHFLKDGRRTISTIFLAGEVLDYSQIRGSGGSLCCLLPGQAQMFNAVVLEKLRQENPQAWSTLMIGKFRCCSQTTNHSVDLARKSAVEKLASFIFECRNRQTAERSKLINLILNRIDIADYMGLRPETLSRAFTKLKQLKMIACERGDYIHILNEPALRQIANGATNELGCAV
jgi:CRP/FNR family transcriptional regulator, anaerobic regulatory protein